MNGLGFGENEAMRQAAQRAMDAQDVRMRAIAMTGSNTPSITCPVCRRTSHNPNDVVERYCGNCRAFHDQMMLALIGPSGVEASEVAISRIASGRRVNASQVLLHALYSLVALTCFAAGKAGVTWWVTLLIGAFCVVPPLVVWLFHRDRS